MDVFSTVAGAIDLAGKITTYIRAVKGAKEDRRKLHSEVSTLGSLLGILQSRLDNNDDISNKLIEAGIRDPLLQCYEDLRHTAEELERIASSVGARKSSSLLERTKDVTWPFRQEDIRAMLGGIERLKSLISLALQTSLIEFVKETRNELKNLGVNVEGAVSALEAAQKAHTKEIKLLRMNLRDLDLKSQDSAHGIAKVEDTVAAISRSQHDHMMKGDRMQADVTIIRENMYNRELQDLVKWLSPLDFGEKHNAIFEKYARDTGEWFLQHPKFLAWRRGDPEYKTLWCPGNPGVGKSVMASLVINELGKVIPENAALVFIYLEYKMKYTVTQLAEVILKQLAQRRMTQSSLKSLRKHKAGIRPTSRELFDMLKIEAGTYDRVLVVIDALDEADIGIWTPLLGHLQALPNISLLTTSRDTGEIGSELQSCQCLGITVDEGDMKRYVEERLESSPKFRQLLGKCSRLGDIHDEIVAGIIAKADGMFLLAQLHMNSLETKLRVTDLRQALNELPKTLDVTYDEAMSRISEDHKALACRVISWLIHAVWPMTIHDLQYALAIEDGMTTLDTNDLYNEAFLTSICVGLVVVMQDTANTGSKIVGLVHYTTQQYFLDNPNLSVKFSDSPNFAITCLKYLTFDIFKIDIPLSEESEKQLEETPFASYAVQSWGVYAHRHWGNKVVRDLATELLEDNQRVITVGSLPCGTKSLSAIHLSTYFKLKDYVESLLDNGCDINLRDSDGDTAVSYAALDGQEEIMQLLLAREEADINARGFQGCTPLVRAIPEGHEAIVRLLLARDDLDVNQCNDVGNTPIFVAAREGHSRIAKLLLTRDGVDINFQNQKGDTPLLVAAILGHEAVVRLLLARSDLDVNRCNDFGSTPILIASSRGHSGIVELLLAQDGVGVNLQNQYENTPLSLAVGQGHEAVVRLLLARNDLDVNLCNNLGNTPVLIGASKGHSGITELLLAEDDVDINLQSQNGVTPLLAAVDRGHEVIVRLLLARNDLDVNLCNNCGSTPVLIAAGMGRSRIVELLLARDGVDINLQNQNGDTPLLTALDQGHEVIVRTLLAMNGLDVNRYNNIGVTPILIAAAMGYNGVVELLLARDGVDINWQNQNGDTPLLAAVGRGHEVIVRTLLARNDLNVNRYNNLGATPILIAAAMGHSGIVELLLARDGTDVNLRGQDGYTPLSEAVYRGHEVVVWLLSARNDLDVNLRNNFGETPVLIAASMGHSRIVELLIARDDVDINSRNQSGDTPLSLALGKGHEAIVQLLLTRADLDTSWRNKDGITYLAIAALYNNEGVAEWFLAKGNTDVNSKDSEGWGPLTWAANRGSDAVVKLLLDQDGIDVNLVDLDGDTPLDHAVREHQESTIELLWTAGGRANMPELMVEEAGRNEGEDRKDEEDSRKDDEDRKDDEGGKEEDRTV